MKMHENDFVSIVTFDLIALLPTNHIIILQWQPEFITLDFNIKIEQTMQNS